MDEVGHLEHNSTNVVIGIMKGWQLPQTLNPLKYYLLIFVRKIKR
jgi:hypothetical protein